MSAPIRIVVALVLVWGVAASAAAPARAIGSITLVPSLIDVTIDAGGSTTRELTVSNSGDEPFAATVSLRPVSSVPDRSAVDWLTIDTADVALDVGDDVSLDIEIDVPDGIASGGHYALVVFTLAGTERAEADGASVLIQREIATGILITVEGEGELEREVEVERFAPFVMTDARIAFRAEVRNTGNVHLRLAGALEILAGGDDPLASLEFVEGTPLLPGTTQTLATQGSLPLPGGEAYTAELAFAFGDEDEDDAPDPVTAAAPFTVAGGTVALEAPGVCENLDRGPTLAATLVNGGDLGFDPTVAFTVRNEAGVDLGYTATPAEAPALWPNDELAVGADFPERLESGAYTLVVVAQVPGGDPLSAEFPFQIGGLEGGVPLCAAS